jgi:hypothetical protein
MADVSVLVIVYVNQTLSYQSKYQDIHPSQLVVFKVFIVQVDVQLIYRAFQAVISSHATKVDLLALNKSSVLIFLFQL